MFRAYLNPEKPRLEANLRVSLGFLPVFWNLGKKRAEEVNLHVVVYACNGLLLEVSAVQRLPRSLANR